MQQKPIRLGNKISIYDSAIFLRDDEYGAPKEIDVDFCMLWTGISFYEWDMKGFSIGSQVQGLFKYVELGVRMRTLITMETLNQPS